jgi:hypothetical protein
MSPAHRSNRRDHHRRPTQATRDPDSTALVREDQLAFTVVTASRRRPLAKQYTLTDMGDLETTTIATLTSGTVVVEHAGSLSDFAARIDRLQIHQAVMYGIPDTPRAKIVTEAQFQDLATEARQGVITRTRTHFQFAYGPGLMMLDLDPSAAPPSLLDAVASPDQTRDLLIRAVPELSYAPLLWRPSSSSYLYDGQRELSGLRGQRMYIPLTRMSDAPMLGKLLCERLWRLGFGYFLVSASGQLLERTLLDGAVWQPERLDFAAGPICVPPITRRAAAACLWDEDGPFFDARSVAGLTANERRAIDAARAHARAELRGVAREKRREWAKERGKAIATAIGVPEQHAEAVAIEAAEHCLLRPDFLLRADNGGDVRVREILAHPDRWHGKRFCDPLEPDYRGDHRIAYANLRPGSGRPYLYSHAHGGTRYTLYNDRPIIRLADGNLPQIVDQCTEIIAAEGEIYQLKDQVVRLTDQGRLEPVAPAWVTDWLQRRANFVRPNKKGWEPKDLPPKYAQTILAKRGEIGLPDLMAVTHGPFLRSDGSVVDQPGYDASTQVLYFSSGLRAPSVRRDLSTAGRSLRSSSLLSFGPVSSLHPAA